MKKTMMKKQIEANLRFDSDDADERLQSPSESKENSGRQSASATPVVDEYGTDITRMASLGVLDPVVAREDEVLRVAQILCRRKKNNPVIIGEPGVGKSAIVEGLATMIVQRRVPLILADKRIVALEMSSLVAGTQYRGQFEARIKKLIDELRSHPEIILFIDEIHTIIGAGSSAGSLDAANILKPALARGEVQCIGATTMKEYRKSIEKDGALERRFQKVQVEPTSAEVSRTILANLSERYGKYHGVVYTDEALDAIISLSERYITGRFFPDKAIDVLDEAGANARMSSLDVALPSDIEEKEQLIERLTKEKAAAAAAQDFEQAAMLRDEIVSLEEEIETLKDEWRKNLQNTVRFVTDSDIERVVSKMTGIPVERMATGESEKLARVHDALMKNVIGQNEAVNSVHRAIVRSRLGMKDANRPVGTFLFVGPTGVGKTHLVKTLATEYFGSPDALIRVDMSEFGEKHTTSRLVGAPPGYVGYDEGGQLTERVRRRPYSVVLFDEIEKAHPDVFNILLQVMDEGRLTDGNGVSVDFRNTIIVLTSNCGTAMASEFGTGIGFESALSADASEKRTASLVMKQVRRTFPPEFLGRLDEIVLFNKLRLEDIERIARLQLSELVARVAANGCKLTIEDEATCFIAKCANEDKSGARALRSVIQSQVEDRLCDLLLANGSASNLKYLLCVNQKENTLMVREA